MMFVCNWAIYRLSSQFAIVLNGDRWMNPQGFLFIYCCYLIYWFVNFLQCCKYTYIQAHSVMLGEAEFIITDNDWFCITITHR